MNIHFYKCVPLEDFEKEKIKFKNAQTMLMNKE